MGIKEKEKKQKLVAGIAALLLFAGVMMIVIKLHGGTGRTVRTGGTIVIDETKGDLEKTWYADAVKQLNQMQQKLSELSKTLEEINQKLDKHEEEIKSLKERVETVEKIPSLPPIPAQKEKAERRAPKVKGAKTVKPVETKARISVPPPPPPPPPSPSAGRKTKVKGKKGQLPAGIEKISFAEQIEKRKEEVEKKRLEVLRKFYIPSGTFVSGILLSGLDAPTGMGAKQDTIPVLITLTDNSILPNDWKYDLKDCRIIGEAYGDLSSERVYIRTNYMSCVDDEGNVYDFAFDGYVAGEDGKVGLRGRVVSKQGALIARALLAGFFEGAGNLMQTSATSMTVTGSGVVTSVNPSQVTRAGVFAGAAESAKKLSEYFMNLLDQTFPVIEVGAGRKVTVVVQKGKWIQKVGKTEEVEVKEKEKGFKGSSGGRK
jgi:conjugal transfer pilus assembly protein TraB